MKTIKKLFITDLDGTFLDEAGLGYDRQRLEALLDDFEREGYLFGVASGRGVLSIERLFAGLTERLVMIAENGGHVRYQDRVLHETVMTREELSRVLSALKANPYLVGDRFLLSGKAGAYASRQADQAYLADISQFYDGVQELAAPEQVSDDIYKLTAQFPSGDLAAAVKDFNGRETGYRAVPVGNDAVDIIRQDINKATGLSRACQELGLSLEQVTAFGDNGNDLEMLSLVGTAVAVANGRAEVKALADDVIGPHQTGAVQTYLEQAVADIRLLALDLDGTLLDRDKLVSPANKEALRLARQAGVQVVITTGRPLKAINHLLEELDLLGADQYSITFNGGLVQANDGQVLSQSGLSLAEVARIHEVMVALDLPLDVLSDETVYSFPASTGFSAYRTVNPHLAFIDATSPADLPTDRTYNKVVIVADQAYLDQRISQLPADVYDQFEVFKSRDILLEIMPKGVTKATGLNQLAQHLGLEAHQVLAMGDEENDLTMLSWAGWGMAVANAVPAAKQAARLTLDATNNQSAVAEAINRYILKEEESRGQEVCDGV